MTTLASISLLSGLSTQSTASVTSPLPSNTFSNAATPASTHQSSDTAAPTNKSSPQTVSTGIIASIVIVAILSLIAIGFCFVDARRRIEKWKEKKQERKDVEVGMWQTELRRGQSGKRDSNHKGLWDGLRIERDSESSRSEEDIRKDIGLQSCERTNRGMGMWEGVGERRNKS